MPVYYLKGDLFLSRAQTIGHGCNCAGRMGRGIALEFKRRWPAMFKEYRRRCHHQQLVPGTYYLEKMTSPWVLNIATQGTTRGASPNYVDACFGLIAYNYAQEGIQSLAMPRIAAGLGGLDWSVVCQLIESHLDLLPIPVLVYSEYVPGMIADEPIT